MKNLTKKQKRLAVAFALLLIVMVSGITYAYFTAANSINTTNNVSVNTIKLANLEINILKMQGHSNNIYPGWVGYQVVTVKGQNAGGIGKYSLTIKSEDYPTELGNSVVYDVYRSNSDSLNSLPTESAFTSNYTQGVQTTESINNGYKYYISGAAFITPNDYEAISQNNLLSSTKNNTITIVDNRSFTGSTKEAYIIVYRYINNTESNQNTQEGKSFTAVINGTLGNVGPQISVAVSNGILMNVENKEIEETIAPSSSVEKSFSLSNPSNEDKYIDINLTDVNNTYSNLKASLSDEEDNVISTKTIPVGTTETVTIKKSVKVEANDSNDYTLIITNQNSNVEPEANLSSKINATSGVSGIDMSIIAYKLDGEDTDKTYSELYTGNYYLDSVSCTQGSAEVLDQDQVGVKITSAPANCTLNFKTSPSVCNKYVDHGAGIKGSYECTKSVCTLKSCYYNNVYCSNGTVLCTYSPYDTRYAYQFCSPQAGFDYPLGGGMGITMNVSECQE